MAIYNSAFERTRLGKTTGPASRLLSWIQMHFFMLILTILYKDQQYLSLAILVIFSFTSIGPLFIIGVGIYFAMTQYWVGLISILLYWIVGFASVRLGVLNNQKKIEGQSANVDPFEYIPETYHPILFQFVAFGIALLTAGIISIFAWVAYILITGYFVMRFAFRLQSDWGKLHYPLMLRYSELAGKEAATAKFENSDSSIDNLLLPLVRGVYPNWSIEELQELIISAKNKLTTLSDSAAIRRYLNNLNPELSDN